MGSSPLARGPLIAVSPLVMSTGLIPARAGTTCLTRVKRKARWAHPRSRGDHYLANHPGTGEKGSSPLARGPPAELERDRRRVGLIPARAGTTARALFGAWHAGAHPRSRGDHETVGASINAVMGSSPLARGPHEWTSSSGRPGGLIPARAGTTQSQPRWTGCRRAHPRSRGDHYAHA